VTLAPFRNQCQARNLPFEMLSVSRGQKYKIQSCAEGRKTAGCEFYQLIGKGMTGKCRDTQPAPNFNAISRI